MADHPSQLVFERHLAGEAPELADHLAGCAACREELEAMTRTGAELDRHRPAIRERLRPRSSPRAVISALAAIAAVALFFVLRPPELHPKGSGVIEFKTDAPRIGPGTLVEIVWSGDRMYLAGFILMADGATRFFPETGDVAVLVPAGRTGLGGSIRASAELSERRIVVVTSAEAFDLAEVSKRLEDPTLRTVQALFPRVEAE